MSSSIRVASRYLAAKSMYDDLGESPGCGLDKVIERARQRRVYTPDLARQTEMYRRNPRGLKPPFDLEQKTYPILQGHDFVVSVPHNMELADGTPWGGSPNLNLFVTLSHHAQLRMDERCVTLPQVKQVFQLFIKQITEAWRNGDASTYKKCLTFLRSGTEGDFITKGDLKVAFSPQGGGAITYMMSESGLPVPNHSDFELKVVTIYQRELRSDENDDNQCIAFLEDHGYRVKPKSKWASLRRYASERTHMTKAYDLTQVLGRAVRAGGVSGVRFNIKYDPERLPGSVTIESIVKKLESMLAEAARLKDSGGSVEDRMHIFYYGGVITIDRVPVHFKQKQPRHSKQLTPQIKLYFDATHGYSEVVFNLELDESKHDLKKTEVVVPPTQVVTPPTVVTYALPPRVDPIQKKIDLCLRTLRDRYIIEPPSREH